jgi:hypothetical protein
MSNDLLNNLIGDIEKKLDSSAVNPEIENT